MEHEVIDITPEKDLRAALEEARKTNKVLNEMLKDANKEVKELEAEKAVAIKRCNALQREVDMYVSELDVYRRLYDQLLEKVMK